VLAFLNGSYCFLGYFAKYIKGILHKILFCWEEWKDGKNV
jgi:hypothetical protein